MPWTIAGPAISANAEHAPAPFLSSKRVAVTFTG
jgi:hypothetical protein